MLQVPRSMQTRFTETSDFPVLLQRRQTVQVPSLVLAVCYRMSKQYMTQQDMLVDLHMKRTSIKPLPPVLAPSSIKHADSVHKGIRHPCPLAKEYDCTETFSRKGDAAIHSKINLGTRYPCPYSAESGCKQDFTSQRGAKEHMTCHSHPFLCLHHGCSERFTLAEDALRHSKQSRTPTY